MKKYLLLICFLVYILHVQAQILYGLTSNGGNDGVGTLIKFIPGTNNLTVSKSFENLTRDPVYTNFIQATDGKLYGMTSFGGNDSVWGTGYGGGVIFSFDPLTSTYTKLKNFDGTDGRNPSGSLIQASDGKLYGLTVAGGSYDDCVIFSFDLSTSTYTKLHDFDNINGAYPNGSLIQASDGKLYGMTTNGGSNGITNGRLGYGVIFSFDPLSSTYTKLKEFYPAAGTNPLGSLVQASNGKLYGMTNLGGSSGHGVIFSFDPLLGNYTKLNDFDWPSGIKPEGSLMQARDGKLYGTATNGGSNQIGVIFSFDLSTSTYTIRMSFDGTNGREPHGSLMQASNGKLYGMTLKGGVNYSIGNEGAGVFFSFDPSTYIYTKLKDFDCTNGSTYGGSFMQASNGKLYGMIRGGVISYDPSTSVYAIAKDFDETTDGMYPIGSLIQANNGKLYGVTISAPLISSTGVIFSFDPTASTFTKLKTFSLGCYNNSFSNNGSHPCGSLFQASDGKLYGMTTSGGGSSGGVNDGNGVIFSFDPSTSVYTKLKDFDGTNGMNPIGSLIQASDGKLYGMTTNGGSIGNGGGGNGNGVIFSYDPSTFTYTTVHYFDVTSGRVPFGSLVKASDGKLYGMTTYGGISDYGVIFSFDPASSTYTKLKNFDGINGANPYGRLMQASDGKLYGMTYGGGSRSFGVIFSLDPLSSIYTKLKDFDSTNGGHPKGNLIQASDGKLYGMTGAGGSYSGGYNSGIDGFGVIFSFDPSTSTYTKLKDFDWANGARPGYGSAFIEVNSVVPVTWGSFTAEKDGKANLLKWNTLHEQNTSRYIVERSADGTHFTSIGFVNAAGYSNVTFNYHFNDAASLPGVNFYRLKQVNTDGGFTYSNIVHLNNDLNASYQLSVAPNPFSNSTTISLSLSLPIAIGTQKVSIKIVDLSGRLVKNLANAQLRAGTHQLSWNTKDQKGNTVPAGVYLLRLDLGKYSETKKLLVK